MGPIKLPGPWEWAVLAGLFRAFCVISLIGSSIDLSENTSIQIELLGAKYF